MKDSSSTSKEDSRWERVRATILSRKRLFVKKGSIVASWRYHNGRKLGPYWRVKYFEKGKPKFLYLGRSETLLEKAKQLLAALQKHTKGSSFLKPFIRKAKKMLKEAKKALNEELKKWGFYMHGWQIRENLWNRVPITPLSLLARRMEGKRSRDGLPRLTARDFLKGYR